MANAAIEARKSGIEFVFIVLAIFYRKQSLSFGLQSDGAFHVRTQRLYLLKDLFPGKGGGSFKESFWRDENGKFLIGPFAKAHRKGGTSDREESIESHGLMEL